MSYLNYFAAAAIVVGAAIWLYYYHVRVGRLQLEERQQVIDWPIYGWVDVYLKVSTLVVTLLALLASLPWLLVLFQHPLLIVLGLLVAGTGLALFVLAMHHLDQEYSDAHRARLPLQIIQAGPYRHIRHPIYTANLLLIGGLILASGSMLLLINLAIILVYYAIMIPREETILRQSFSDYGVYCESTGRIFPRLKSFGGGDS